MVKRRPYGCHSCPSCDGTGKDGSDLCVECEGDGYVNVIEMFDYPAPLGDEGGP